VFLETDRGMTLVASSKQRLEGLPTVLGQVYATAILQGGAKPHIFNPLLVDYILGQPIEAMRPKLQDIPKRGNLVYESLKMVSVRFNLNLCN
jgi:hypothetical protein